MSRQVDLAAIRAETTADEPIELVDGKTVIPVHPIIPWEVAVAWGEDRIDDVTRALCVNPQDAPRLRDMLLAGGASKVEAARRVNAIYNVDEGESSAS